LVATNNAALQAMKTASHFRRIDGGAIVAAQTTPNNFLVDLLNVGHTMTHSSACHFLPAEPHIVIHP
jgi:hypothetical protein